MRQPRPNGGPFIVGEFIPHDSIVRSNMCSGRASFSFRRSVCRSPKSLANPAPAAPPWPRGISPRAVQRLWEANRLQPHRLRTFKRSNDPKFAEKVEDVVGLYMDPPAHAVVVSIDEKSRIQALDRPQPGLPLKPGKCGTMTHDYKRNGTTTLFAALNILDGTVIGRCMNKHRHQEFIRFLNSVDRAVPSGKLIHAVIDNYATHKHPNVLKWLAAHPRWTFHFTPTSASWLNKMKPALASKARWPASGPSAAAVRPRRATS